MEIRSLALTDFRCHASVRMSFGVTPGSGIAIVGDNATGKTSLLEAIYLLSRGLSFRGSSPTDVIRHDCDHALVVGEFDRLGEVTRVAVQRERKQLQARLGPRRDASVLDLARALPVQVLDPRAHRLIDEGPVHRRRLLDWGVFHVEQSFIQDWRQFQRLLRQRNAACRQRDVTQLRVWNPAYVEYSRRIDAARQRHLEQITGLWAEHVNALIGADHSAKIHYRAGWPKGVALEEVLASVEQRELDAGHSVVGPHRADIRFQLDGRQVRHQASRGQQKALVLALLLAQVEVVSTQLGDPPILLVDDFGAEWGASMRARAVQQLNDSPVQWISTWLDQPESTLAVGQMFHVEHLGGAAP